MKANFECVNSNCGYSTNRNDNLKIKDLIEIVNNEGGCIDENDRICPKCKKNTLFYISE